MAFRVLKLMFFTRKNSCKYVAAIGTVPGPNFNYYPLLNTMQTLIVFFKKYWIRICFFAISLVLCYFLWIFVIAWSWSSGVKQHRDITAALKDSLRVEEVTNSFKAGYEQSNPTLHYECRDSGQVHDYSGNWDFDNDGKTDSLLFIGNGGAHLYFHLRIVLSTDHKVNDLPFFLDFPQLGNIKDLENDTAAAAHFPQFVVHDFDGDGTDDIFLDYDPFFSTVPGKWKITSRRIVLTYKQGIILTRDYRK